MMLRVARTSSCWRAGCRALSNAGAPPPNSSGGDASGLSAFEQTVGNTRLVRLSHASQVTGCDILGKAEYENPGGSIKDRAALFMVQQAERDGLLVRGRRGVIVEGTAGNTGIGLALAGQVFGYDTVIVLADTQSEEKKQLLRWAGARVVEVPAVAYKNPQNYVHVAARLAESLRRAGEPHVFYANQWDNLANRRAHAEGTGPEIWRQTGGAVDAFSCAMGTGGTLSGVAEYLRSVHPGVQIALTDPCGAAVKSFYETGTLAGVGGSISEGVGQGRITGNMEGFAPDFCLEVPDEEMLPVLHDLQRCDGLALGGSAGINVAGAIRVAQRLGPGHRVVTMLCDVAGRYSQKLYNPDFLHAKGLPSPPWLTGGADRVPGDGLLNDAAALGQLVDEALHVGDDAVEAE